MADYKCHARTNYFHVKDPEAFRAFMARANDVDELWEEKDAKGMPVFGFSAYGFPTLNSYRELPDGTEEGEEYDEDAFIEGLQSHLAADDAFIYTEIGHEKLRYLVGHVTVITSTAVKGLDLEDFAFQTAKEMLDNDQWNTKNEY